MRALGPGRLLRAVAHVLPSVGAIVLVGFLLVHMSPGDPVFALGGEYGNAEYYQTMRARFALDESLAVQLVTYVGRVLTGDLGTSYVQGRPVLAVIAERLPATVLLAGSALMASSLMGLLLGAVAASRVHGVRDVTVTAVTLALYAAPVFWLGQLAILFVSSRIGWLPIQGMNSVTPPTTALGNVLDVGRHLLLPTLVLASQQMVAVSRLTRAEMVDQLRQPFVRTARAKGLTELVVLGRHAMRLALLPVVTLIGHRVGHLVAGAAIVEIVFGWPGLGRLMVDAIQTRDQPVLLGMFLLMACAVVVANIITDSLYRPLDARIEAAA